MREKKDKIRGVMLNAYPDSIGELFSNTIKILKSTEMSNCFSDFYILPSLYHSDLDRGFSVIDYDLNEELVVYEELEELKKMGISLKLDFVLNHASVQSMQFQDLLEKGEDSKYKDFFISWNDFWEGKGEMTSDGYIQPKAEYIKDMFFRKPGLPILMVPMPNGKEVPYWNTFYQEINYDENRKKKFLGQMDLNIKSELVWEFYKETLGKLAKYGAEIVRLDAFAYAPKEVGLKNFMNEPGTWELLESVRKIADDNELILLPEIHASYEENVYRKIAQKGYMTYDFFLPGLILDAFEKSDATKLGMWANELISEKISVVNMLGCHDGIPLLDLKGLISEERIQELIDVVVARGGYVKELHGKKNMYYQVNATYYSALGEDDKKLILARAIQMFMPGKPQVWYLDLFAGKNDYEAVKKAGAGGHKEINRTNLSIYDIESVIKTDIVKKQLELIRFRNTSEVFSENSIVNVSAKDEILEIVWKNKDKFAKLKANMKTYDFEIDAE